MLSDRRNIGCYLETNDSFGLARPLPSFWVRFIQLPSHRITYPQVPESPW